MIVNLFSFFFRIFLHIWLHFIAQVNLVSISLLMSHLWSKLIIHRFLHFLCFINIYILTRYFPIKPIIIITRTYKVFYLIGHTYLRILNSLLIIDYPFNFINVHGICFWIWFGWFQFNFSRLWLWSVYATHFDGGFFCFNFGCLGCCCFFWNWIDLVFMKTESGVLLSSLIHVISIESEF